MVASRVNVRELQSPLKERYRADPAAARITLHASGGESDLADPLHALIHVGSTAYRTVPIGLESIHCHTRVQVGEPNPERACRLLEHAERYCVVLNTLRNGVAVESRFALAQAGEARPEDDGASAP